MAVLEDGERGELPVQRARGDDREFLLELHERLVDAFRPVQSAPCRLHLIRGGELRLAFAVVAEVRRLEHGGQAEFARGGVQILQRPDATEWRDGKAIRREEGFFAKTVLRGMQHASVGAHGNNLRRGRGRGGGDILELECHHLHLPGEFPDALEVVVSVGELAVADLSGGRVVVRRIDEDAIAQLTGGEGEHAPELSAAEHADGRAGEDRLLFQVLGRGGLRCVEHSCFSGGER